MPRYPDDFGWTNAPPDWTLRAGTLSLTTAPDTDFWQRTHYGFRRDNGHMFAARVGGDFSLSARIRAEPNAQYDQAGLVCRVGPEDWAKCSVEAEDDAHSRLGSVVTVGGTSDWATQDVPASLRAVWYRLDRRGADLRFCWSEDGEAWRQMRIAHLDAGARSVRAGVYACSPTGPGFRCHADHVAVGATDWARPE